MALADDNRAGGDTVVGIAVVTRAPAGGRVLLLASFDFATDEFMVRNLLYKQSTLGPLALLMGTESTLVTRAEFTSYVKAESARWGSVIHEKNIQPS